MRCCQRWRRIVQALSKEAVTVGVHVDDAQVRRNNGRDGSLGRVLRLQLIMCNWCSSKSIRLYCYSDTGIASTATATSVCASSSSELIIGELGGWLACLNAGLVSGVQDADLHRDFGALWP